MSCDTAEQCCNVRHYPGFSHSSVTFFFAACTTAKTRTICRTYRWRIISRARPRRGPARPRRPARPRHDRTSRPPRPRAVRISIRPAIRSTTSRNRRSRRSTQASRSRCTTTRMAVIIINISTITANVPAIRRRRISCLAIRVAIRSSARQPCSRRRHRRRRPPRRRSIRSDTARRSARRRRSFTASRPP